MKCEYCDFEGDNKEWLRQYNGTLVCPLCHQDQEVTSINLSKTEKTVLLSFLEELIERFGNDGCNDNSMPDTPENREFLKAVSKESDEVNYYVDDDSDLIYGDNMEVVSYLISRVKEQ